jgi:pyruvate,water dikinase
LEKYLSDKTVAVRSSAPGEDAAKTSFAGLHESFICITGAEAILEHIPLVWASLWSDRALLYRRELGLDVEKSTMAVVIQEMIAGDRSGVAFGMNPLDASQSVIEAVHGLNQGLVDGTIEPDRWVLRRRTGEILSYVAAPRDQALFFRDGRVRYIPLTKEKTETPPLEEAEIGEVFRLTRAAEELFDAPQDVEWTYRKESLLTLQSRPITSGPPA